MEERAVVAVAVAAVIAIELVRDRPQNSSNL